MKHAGVRLLAVTALVGGGLTVLPATAQAAEVTATLVKETQTGRNSAWAAQGHPSPDPSGITYNSRTGKLIISDGEVEERGGAYPNHVWNGTNLFVADLDGTLAETGLNSERFSVEPTGVGFRPDETSTAGNEERLFVSDDDANRIFEVSHGGDGKYGNGDDTWTFTSVTFAGPNVDAEDVAVDLELTRQGQLLLLDELDRRVFVLSAGPDGTYNGSGDTVVRQFDVGAAGAVAPEGIAYNRSRDTLFVLDDASSAIYEYRLTGELLNTIRMPFRTGSAAGLTMAPPSANPTGPMNVYIVDRGVDNDTTGSGDPTAFNDGRILEVAIPGLTSPGTPPPSEPAPRQGSWFYLNDSLEGGKANKELSYGDPGDTVLVADTDGANGDSLLIRRGNTYFVRNSLATGKAEYTFVYGDPGDTVLVGDWNGDGIDTLAVRRGNTYYIKNSTTTGTADQVITYGDPGDTVLVGDWDNDGRDTLAVRRGNQYFLKNSMTTGNADRVITYGDPGDTVLVGRWKNDTTGLAVQRNTTFYFKFDLNTGTHDLKTNYGDPGDVVLVGDWNGDGGDSLGVRRIEG